MKISVEAITTLPDWCACGECKRRKDKLLCIALGGNNVVYLCPSCLNTLRSKIDALSILVQTGINMKE